MKLKIKCIETYEIIQPATSLISQNMLTGERFETGVKIEESRFTVPAGRILTVNKGEWLKTYSPMNKWTLV